MSTVYLMLVLGSCLCYTTNGLERRQVSDACAESDCNQATEICVRGEINGFACVECFPGYTPSDDGHTCIDINECAVDSGGCEQTCINTPGSFFCKCLPFSTLSFDKKTCRCNTGMEHIPPNLLCQDKDECTIDIDNCNDETEMCINVMGTYACAPCAEGYKSSSDGLSCVDIDECSDGEDGCEWGCDNTMGGWQCTCPESSRLTADGITCQCDSGMERIGSGTGLMCVDLDECSAGVDGGACGDNEICLNIPGSFACYQCPDGFHVSTDGTVCEEEIATPRKPGKEKHKPRGRKHKSNESRNDKSESFGSSDSSE